MEAQLLAVDLSTITDEDLLRNMWHQAEDFSRRKEIRAYMYKLREQRLKDFYASNDSSPPYFLMDNASATFGVKKSTVSATPGGSLVDQSFQSFKAKEIRDSEGPTRFGNVTSVPSDNSGWQIKTSEEVSDDGKTHTVRTSATTQGTKEMEGGGGRTTFAGRNLESHSEHFDGDDSNFVHSQGDQTSTVLVEDSTTEGVDGSRQMAGSTRSTTTSVSSTHVVRKQQNGEGGKPTGQLLAEAVDLTGNGEEHLSSSSAQKHSVTTSSSSTSNTVRSSATSNTNRDEMATVHKTTNVTDEHHAAKAKELSTDPDRVREAFRLAQGSGKVLECEETMINASTKMITETKLLDDGTTVTTRTYERIGATEPVPVGGEQFVEQQDTRSKTVRTQHVQQQQGHHQKHQQQDTVTLDGKSRNGRLSDISANASDAFMRHERQQERTEQDQQRTGEQASHHTTNASTMSSHRISVEVDAAHDSFARSLRSISPTGSVRSVRSNATIPDSQTRESGRPARPGRHSPSHESESKPDYMRSTFTSERKLSNFREQAQDAVQSQRSPSPRKVPANTPQESRGSSPVKQASEKTIGSMQVEVTRHATLDSSTTEENNHCKQEVDSGRVRGSKPPLVRSETYEERCRKILGMPHRSIGEEGKPDGKVGGGSLFSTYDNTITTQQQHNNSPRSELREQRKKIEQEIKSIESETLESNVTRRTSAFLADERDSALKETTSSSAKKDGSSVRMSLSPEPLMAASTTRKRSPTPKDDSAVQKTGVKIDLSSASLVSSRTVSQDTVTTMRDKTIREATMVEKPSLKETSPTRNPTLKEASPTRKPSLQEGSPTRKPAIQEVPASRKPSMQDESRQSPVKESPATRKPSKQEASPTRKPSQQDASPTRKPSQHEASPTRKPSQQDASPTRKPSQHEASPTRKPSQQDASPTRKPSQQNASPTRKPSQHDASPARKPSHQDASPTRKPSQQDATATRKPSQHEPSPTRKPTQQNTSPTRKPSQQEASPTRKPSQQETSPTRKSSQTTVSPTRKPSPMAPKDTSPVRKYSEKEVSPAREASRKVESSSPSLKSAFELESVQQSTVTGGVVKENKSKATILVEQRQEGRQISVAEITIVPVVEVSEGVRIAKSTLSSRMHEKVLTKQSSDTKFDRRTTSAATSGRAITGKSSSDFDVKRRAAEVAAGNVARQRTAATSPDKRRTTGQLSSDSRTTSTTKQNHITVAKIKIDPLRKPVLQGKTHTTAEEWTSTRSSRARTATDHQSSARKLPEPETDPESSKDTGISDNSEVEETVERVIEMSVTGTSCCRHSGSTVTDRKDSAPVVRTTGAVRSGKSYTRSSSDNHLRATNVSRATPGSVASRPAVNGGTAAVARKSERPVKHVATKTINLSTKVATVVTEATTSTARNATTTFDSDHLDNVVIDIQQAKSSREPTPNKLVPIPVSPDTEDNGRPRYPDAVQEPDDERVPPAQPRVSNIPIFEEATNEFVGCEITEVNEQEATTVRGSGQQHATRITNLDRVTEDDESLLSVTEKVSKFIHEARRLQEPAPAVPVESSRQPQPARFVVRHEYDDIDEHLKSDECLLSVSDKVTKFISTAEEVKKIRTSGPFVPEVSAAVGGGRDGPASVTDGDACLLSVNDKVSRFASRIVGDGRDEASIRRSGADEGETDGQRGEDDEMTVGPASGATHNVAEKVSRFVPQKSPELVKNAMRSTARHVVGDQGVLNGDDVSRTASGPSSITERYRTATVTKPFEKQTAAPAEAPSSPIALRSTEAVKKAKEIFEKAQTGQDARQRDILNRPSIWEDRRNKQQQQQQHQQEDKMDHKGADVKLTDIGVYRKQVQASRESHATVDGPLKEPEMMEPTVQAAEEPVKPSTSTTRRDSGSQQRAPAYIRDTVSSKKDLFEKRISSSRMQVEYTSQTSQDGESVSSSSTSRRLLKQGEAEQGSGTARSTSSVDQSKPSYMNHTVASLEHINANQRRESFDHSTAVPLLEQPPSARAVTVGGSKFGVELKRLDSGSRTAATTAAPVAVVPAQTPAKRKTSGAGAAVSDVDIEEISDVEVLERMLESVTGYEQRRRIRAQIRLVKKRRVEEPASGLAGTGRQNHNTAVSTKSVTITTTNTFATKRKDSSPTRASLVRKTSATIDSTDAIGGNTKRPTNDGLSDAETVVAGSKQPQENGSRKNQTGTTTTKTSTATTKVSTERFGPKTGVVDRAASRDERPIWATSNILKKASENTRSFKSSSVTTSATSTGGSTTTVKKTVSSSSSSHQTKASEPKSTTDCITSSYGVGPMDENGLPLFGIRALKRKATPAPAMEDALTTDSKLSGTIVTETLYAENGGPTMGKRSTTHYSTEPGDLSELLQPGRRVPEGELMAITRTEKIDATGKRTEEIEVLDSARTANVVRKGSVKELTERFVHRESSGSLHQDTRVYPKGGVSLRSTAHSHSSRASTPATDGCSVESGSVDDLAEQGQAQGVELRRGDGHTRTSMTTSSSSTRQVRSFLNDSTKVVDVQDVLQRMSNADNVEELDDTAEDHEARALLNKFLGASVLMSGVESMVSSAGSMMSESAATPATGKKVSKVSTTTTTKTQTVKSSGGTPNTASTPARQATVDNLEEIWDEAVLKQLLEASTSYDDRRKIRARIRQIMAEKEACADIVAIVTADLQRERHLQQQSTAGTPSSASCQSATAVAAGPANGLPQGESLLLPLLQGLLLSSAVTFGYNRGASGVAHGGSSGGSRGSGIGGSDGRSSGGISSATGSGTLAAGGSGVVSVPPVEDSGTESGEDLRLLAAAAGAAGSGTGGPAGADAGLGAALPGILHEVTGALERLQLTLRGESLGPGCAEVMQLDAEKRDALLALVTRLQQGLLQPDKIAGAEGAAGSGSVGGRTDGLNDACDRMRRPPTSSQASVRAASNGEVAGDEQMGGKLDDSQGRLRAGGSSRFSAKRRTNRNNRHTVGVSREELADARRFIEEMVMMDSRQQPECVPAPEKTYLLQKQQSLGTVLGVESPAKPATAPTPLAAKPAALDQPTTPATAFAMKRPSQFVPKEMQNVQTSLDKLALPAARAAATSVTAAAPAVHARTKLNKEKLLLSRQALSVDQALPPSATGDSALDRQDAATKPIDLHKHKTTLVRQQQVQPQQQQQPQPPQQPQHTDQPFKKPTQTATQRALVKKYSFNDGSSSEDDDARVRTVHKPDEPKKTAEQMVLRNKITPAESVEASCGSGGSLVINTVQKIVSREAKTAPEAVGTRAASGTGRTLRQVQHNHHHSHHQGRSRTPESLSKPEESLAKPVNKYTSKKLRMKRANTIDIPKNLLPNGASDDDRNDEEEADSKMPSRKRTTAAVAALAAAAAGTQGAQGAKQPLPGATPVEVPDFKPRTENDLKFMAFLQKQNQQPRQMWSNPVREHVGSNNWTNKFDHLKNNFEQATDRRSRSELPPKYGAPKPSAMSFWKQAENGSADEPTGKALPAVKQPPVKTSMKPGPSQQSPTTSQLPKTVTASPGKYAPATFSQTLLGKDPLDPGNRIVEGKLVLPKPKAANLAAGAGSTLNQFSHASASAFKPIPKKLPSVELEFKPIQYEPDIVRPIPARVSNATGLVKQIVATGFKETPDVKSEPMHVQLGLVRSLAAQGYQETPYVPLPKLERTPTHNVLNYKARPDAASSVDPAPAAPWVGKRSSDPGNRVASIAATKFTANPFGHNKQVLPAQQPLTYQGSLKYAERPLAYQLVGDGGAGRGLLPYEKRPSLPDVSTAHLGTYTFTDYTHPESVSTFSLLRSDSLTNPENEPLVLTSANSVFSPTATLMQAVPRPLQKQQPHQPTQISYLAVNVDQHSSSSHSPANPDDDDDDDDGYDYDDLESVDSQEMRVVSKVMQAPQGQQATYSAPARPTHLRNGHEQTDSGRGSLIAQSLHTSLKKIKDKSPTPPKYARQAYSHERSPAARDGRRPMAAPLQPPQLEVTPPVPSHAIYNNVQQFQHQRFAADQPLARTKSSHNLTVPVALQQLHPISSEKQRTVEAYFAGQSDNRQPAGHTASYQLGRTASNHNLVLRDKSGLAGQHSVRPVSYAMGHNVGYYNGGQQGAYGQQPSPFQQQHRPSHHTLTGAPSYQTHQHHQHPPQSLVGGGLLRSRTMPHIPLGSLALLDENNVEDAFEELMNQSFAV